MLGQPLSQSEDKSSGHQVNRECSRLGHFIAEQREWELATNRNYSQKKGLGALGLSMLFLGIGAFYLGWLVCAAVLVILGVGITGFIPRLTAPSQPIMKSFMASTTPSSQHPSPQHSPKRRSTCDPLSREAEADSPSAESMLTSVGGRAAPISFRVQVEEQKSKLNNSAEDTLDLVRRAAEKKKKKPAQ